MDDVTVFSNDSMLIIQEFKRTYIMKGVGNPQYYLGGDVVGLGPEWEKESVSDSFSAKTYIHNALPKLAKSCGLQEFQKFNTSFEPNYHPESDESELLPEDQISVYKSLLRSANWTIH